MPKPFRWVCSTLATAILIYAAYDVAFQDGQFFWLVLDLFMEFVSVLHDALTWVSNMLAEFIYMPA